MEKTKPGEYVLHGELTIKGVTKKIMFNAVYYGVVKDPWGTKKAGFETSGKINRKDFGLTWNTVLETGSAMVSDMVFMRCEIQLAQQFKS